MRGIIYRHETLGDASRLSCRDSGFSCCGYLIPPWIEFHALLWISLCQAAVSTHLRLHKETQDQPIRYLLVDSMEEFRGCKMRLLRPKINHFETAAKVIYIHQRCLNPSLHRACGLSSVLVLGDGESVFQESHLVVMNSTPLKHRENLRWKKTKYERNAVIRRHPVRRNILNDKARKARPPEERPRPG